MKDNQASTTAYTVAHGILHTATAKGGRELVGESMLRSYEKLLMASREGRRRLDELQNPLKRLALPALEWLLMPGITLNYVLRKRFIEEQVRLAVANGVTQVINVGAGFDTLMWRLCRENEGLQCIEIDHPATSREKRTMIEKSDGMPENLSLCAADLSQASLEEALNATPGFDSARKTLYICEGVMMYLGQRDVIGIFESIKKISGSGSTLVFSALEPRGSHRNNIRPLLYTYLWLKSESYRWYIHEEDMDGFLEAREYKMDAVADSTYYEKQNGGLLNGRTLHKGEYVVVATAY